jgi:hypothetical protein
MDASCDFLWDHTCNPCLCWLVFGIPCFIVTHQVAPTSTENRTQTMCTSGWGCVNFKCNALLRCTHPVGVAWAHKCGAVLECSAVLKCSAVFKCTHLVGVAWVHNVVQCWNVHTWLGLRGFTNVLQFSNAVQYSNVVQCWNKYKYK